jgi:two-component system, LuxR family, response regulator FixJ
MGTRPPERTVHVVNDDPDVCRSLERLLLAWGYTPVLYATASDVIEHAADLSDGCILLDLQLHGIDWLELQARLNHLGVSLPVIVLTEDGNVPTAVRAMKAGAVDFIDKPSDDKRLLVAIEAALASIGQAERDREAAKAQRDREAAEAAQRIGALSPRERQVLDGLVAGRPNKVIARDLGISVRTVEVHRARMLERLGIRRASQAIRLAVLATLALPP